MSKLDTLIENKLKKLNKNYKDSGTGFILSQCINPEHIDTHESFSVNLETGFGFCFTCDYKVEKEFWGELGENDLELFERTAKYKDMKDRYKKEEKEKVVAYLPDKTSNIDFLLKDNKYRGISKEYFNMLEIYFCDNGFYKNRIVFPINYKGNIFFSTRTLDKEKKNKYLHSKGFEPKNLIYPYNLLEECDITKVVLTEGIFDTLSCWEIGVPSICNFGVANNFSQDKINELIKLGVEEIYIMMDKDEAGEKHLEKFLNSNLTDYFIIKPASKLHIFNNYYKSEYKDLNDYLQGKKND